ncbi:MAG: type II toxin-antitoxin system RelE/ParE family toxin [Clostridia bacterium]|nr:type II toxin-antitoxin system RelE/ParE family toxin [Clostridia bacterium]
MEKWRILFYETPAGNCPVKEFIRNLSPEKKAATIEEIDLLEEFGIALGMPHARPLSDGIWELRARASDGLTRILYFSASKERRTFVLLHGVEKDQRVISDTDRKIAIKRKKDYERRP